MVTFPVIIGLEHGWTPTLAATEPTSGAIIGVAPMSMGIHESSLDLFLGTTEG